MKDKIKKLQIEIEELNQLFAKKRMALDFIYKNQKEVDQLKDLIVDIKLNDTFTIIIRSAESFKKGTNQQIQCSSSPEDKYMYLKEYFIRFLEGYINEVNKEILKEVQSV